MNAYIFISVRQLLQQIIQFSSIRTAMKKDFQKPENHPRNSFQKLQNQNREYFSEYLKICKITQVLSQNMSAVHQKQQRIKQRIQVLSNKLDDIRDPFRKQKPQPKRNIRRVSNQIQKQYICQKQGCQKMYASYLSLKIHQKLKHPELIIKPIIDHQMDDKMDDLNVDF